MLLGKISCILLTKASMASSSSRHSLLFVREGRVKWEGLTSRKSKLSYWGPRLCGVSGSGLCTGTMGLSGWLELANLDNKRVCKFKIYTHRISYPHKFIYEKNYKSFSAVTMNDELNKRPVQESSSSQKFPIHVPACVTNLCKHLQVPVLLNRILMTPPHKGQDPPLTL